MTWTILIWILLYFAVGWLLTKAYDLDDGIGKLLMFLGWPIHVACVLVILVLLFLFGLLCVTEEILHKIKSRRKEWVEP